MPAEVRKQYDDNPRRFGKVEQRDAAHILITVKPDASAEDKAAAKKKAEEIAAQARKTPAQFAEMAKKLSQDTGSAAEGGDLGFFAHDGSMVKPFEDAVFGMKVGEIAGPVQTGFGWHVIKLIAIQPAQQQAFDQVKGQIEQDLRRQQATRKFAEVAEQLQNLVYEQADSLQPTAKTLNLTLQSTPLLTRAQVQALGQNNPKFVQAVFSADSLQSKRNTEAIEIAPETLMAAHVVEYKPAVPRPYDEVKAEIRSQLEHRAASELAQKAGRSKLALLQEGKDAGLTFGKPVTVARNGPQQGFAQPALTAIFQADAAKLPAYAGAANERGGYSLYRIERVIVPPAPDAARLTAFTNRIGEQIGHELAAANVASLRAKSEVKINQASLEKDLRAALRRTPRRRRSTRGSDRAVQVAHGLYGVGDRLVALGRVVIHLAAVFVVLVDRRTALERLQPSAQLHAAVELGLGIGCGFLRLGFVCRTFLLQFLDLGILRSHLPDRVRIAGRHGGIDAFGLDAGRGRVAVDDAALFVGPFVQGRAGGQRGEEQRADGEPKRWAEGHGVRPRVRR